MIDVGALAAGDKLPSVRAYAVERRVNPNTVAKAYAALEEEGYITVRLKKGAFVATRTGGACDMREEILRQARAWKAAGVEEGVALAEIKRAYGEDEDV